MDFNLSYWHKECIVLLYEKKKIDTNTYNIVIDFRTRDDLKLFQLFIRTIYGIRYQDIVNDYKSMVIFRNIKSSKRLIEGCYYNLNLNHIPNKRIEPLEDSYVLGALFEMDEMQVPDNNELEFLQTHEQLDPNEILVKNPNENITLPTIGLQNLKLRVRNVEQANWNEIISDGQTKIVFDIGMPLHSSITEINNYCQSIKLDFKKDKPTLILSHWDLDHFICLKSFSSQEIQACFSNIICVNQFKSVASKNVFEQITKALEKNCISCITPHYKTKARNMHQICSNNNVSLYIGEQSHNINYSGISMFVRGCRCSVNFTGDQKLKLAENTYLQELNKGLQLSHILIAPHHGGQFGNTINSYPQPCNQVIISVGQNSYGHPVKKMLDFYKQISDNNTLRTDNISVDIEENI